MMLMKFNVILNVILCTNGLTINIFLHINVWQFAMLKKN